MTIRCVVAYAVTAGALGYIAATAIIVRGADLRDWYERVRDPHPVWRLAWR